MEIKLKVIRASKYEHKSSLIQFITSKVKVNSTDTTNVNIQPVKQYLVKDITRTLKLYMIDAINHDTRMQKHLQMWEDHVEFLEGLKDD